MIENTSKWLTGEPNLPLDSYLLQQTVQPVQKIKPVHDSWLLNTGRPCRYFPCSGLPAFSPQSDKTDMPVFSLQGIAEGHDNNQQHSMQ
jgi:hypothetical protein